MTDIDLIDQILDDTIATLEYINPRIPLMEIDVQHCRIAYRDHKKSKRVYAHVGCKVNTICVSKYLEHDLNNGKLHIGNIHGILVHEIGHLIHDRYGHHDRNKVQWVDLD